MKPKKMRMPTTIQVGFLIRAMLCLSASSSTAEASRAPAFLTYKHWPAHQTSEGACQLLYRSSGSVLGEFVRTCSSLVVILVL